MHDYSDPQTEELLRSISLSNGFNAWTGMELIAAGNGQVELLMPVRSDMLQHHGFVHGGIVGALADTACSWAAATAAGGDVVTSSYTMQLLAPAKSKRLRAKCATLKAGKRIVSVQADIYAETDGEEPRHVATALDAISVIGRKDN